MGADGATTGAELDAIGDAAGLGRSLLAGAWLVEAVDWGPAAC
jgi:hypothetical protein